MQFGKGQSRRDASLPGNKGNMKARNYGRHHQPIGKGNILEPKDGYRRLAADILLPVVDQLNRGRNVERNLAFVLSNRAWVCFELLDLDPDEAVAAILRRNGLETINYAERIRQMRSNGNGR